MESYFQSGLIDAGILIVDARHAPSEDDVQMLNWFRQTGCPLTVVANKLDKLKKSEREGSIRLVAEPLGLAESDVLIPFSAEDGTGRDALLRRLEALS